MSAPLADGEVIIKIVGELVSKPYIDITLHIMQQFGVQVINKEYQEFVIPAGQKYLAPGISWSRAMLLLLRTFWLPPR